MLVRELKGRRAALVTQMREIAEKAEAEDRDLSAEESQEFERIEAEVDGLKRRIDRIESLPADDNPARQPTAPEGAEERGGPITHKSPEYRDAFEALVRNRGNVGALNAEHRAALQVGTDSEGGYTVPDEFYRQLIEAEREYGVMRQLATVITTANSGDLKIPGVDTRATAAWTAEEAAYTESEDTFKQTTLSSYKVGALAKVSDELIHDSAFDILGFLARSLGQAVAIKENNAFVDGASGSTTTPEGIVNKATVGQQYATGNTTSVTSDHIFDVFHSLLAPYRRNATWLADDATIKAIRKLKDADNQYLWQPGLQAGQPDLLLGRPIVADPDVPTMAASAKSLVFGDIAAAYYIRDVEGVTVKVLNELYAANGQVGFRISRRTDGDLVDSSAVRLGQNSAT